MGYLIGVDTGGTYTDAAIIEDQSHSILATAKAITTKGDLSIGVAEAIGAAFGKLSGAIPASEIELVSVSTTLATNAVVEGHGNPVGVLLIGFDARMVERTGIAKAFPGILIQMIAGGHDHNGEEAAKLDVAAIAAAADAMVPEVSAFAIASAFAVRNGAHELRAREIVTERTGKPATISTELTSALDAPRRALTAVLNARLISRISMLIAAVERAMKGLNIVCPLMIVKGDGSMAKAQSVMAKPIETVLSGPAASLVGARWLSGLDDFIMSDMGGTTTDIGVLMNGRPQVAEQGAEVGGWRTMVKAIDVKTLGLGGDSEVHLSIDGSIELGPQRVVPISLLGIRFPEVIAMLQADMADADGGSMHGRFLVLPFGAANGGNAAGLTKIEQEVLARVSDRPIQLRKVAVSSAAQRAVGTLRKKGLIQFCALTPSDVAHVLDMQDNWSKPAAVLAAQLALRFRDMRAGTPERIAEFCQAIWSRTVALSARAILDTAFALSPGANTLVDSVCAGTNDIHLGRVKLSPRVPIVAVGGPVKVFYGEVAKRLECEVVFAPNCDVANAVGAAAGFVAHRVVVTVDGDGNGAFRVHGGGASQVFSVPADALGFAEKTATEKAIALALEFGAHDPRTNVQVEKHYLPEARGDDGLLQAIITVEAVGRPARS